MTTIKTFNTGRQYSPKGQRIAYAVLSTGNIAMVDVDRGIDYTLVRNHPELPLRDSTVLALYDANATRRDYNDKEYSEFCDMRDALIAAAKSI